MDGETTLTGSVGIGTEPLASTALLVQGNVSVHGDTALNDMVHVGDNLFVGGTTDLMGPVYAGSTTRLNGDVGMGGAAVAGTDLTVYGTSKLTGDVGIGGVPTSLTGGGDLKVYGASILTGAVGIGGSTVVNRALYVWGTTGQTHLVVDGTSTLGETGCGGAVEPGYALKAHGPIRVTGNVRSDAVFYELNRTAPIGYPIDVPYNASQYSNTGGSGTWTVEAGDQIYKRYYLVGRLAFVQFSVATTTISGGTPTFLLISGFPGPSGTAGASGIAEIAQGGTSDTGLIIVRPDNGWIHIRRLSGASWTMGTNNLAITGTVVYEIA